MPISGKTGLLGLIGWPVEHSFSPAMHNAAARALGLDVVYVPLPTRPEHIEAAVRGLPALGFLGANVTVPHKQAVMPLLDEVDPAARAIGAVNTIRIGRESDSRRQAADRRRQTTDDQSPHSPISNLQSPIPNQLIGFNTDHSGFLADLQAHDVALPGRDCLVLGAGGAARAVVYALAQAGARVHVYARRPAQAEQLVAALGPHLQDPVLVPRPWDALADAVALSAPLVVNTTPVGMHPDVDASPWPADLAFPSGAVIYDLIYNPRQTRLMQEAQAAGCRAINGLGMLLQQGALAFEIWMGVRPPLEVMEGEIGE